MILSQNLNLYYGVKVYESSERRLNLQNGVKCPIMEVESPKIGYGSNIIGYGSKNRVMAPSITT